MFYLLTCLHTACVSVECSDVYMTLLAEPVTKVHSVDTRVKFCLRLCEWVCKPVYLVPVPSQDKVGGLRQEGHPA